MCDLLLFFLKNEEAQGSEMILSVSEKQENYKGGSFHCSCTCQRSALSGQRVGLPVTSGKQQCTLVKAGSKVVFFRFSALINIQSPS